MMSGSVRYWLLLCCWLGAALRFRGLFANTFHADEALFAGWARHIAVWGDPLLLTQAVDKPPLLFYLQALFYPLFGPVEWAARVPAFIASLLLIPLTAQLAWRLTGDRLAGLVAASIMAVTPLTVQFSATAFADPLLTLWLVAVLYAAAEPLPPDGARRSGPLWAGLLLGLALATKYQALLFAPLLVGLAWLAGWRNRDWGRSLAGLAAVLLVLLVWQLARPQASGLIDLQWANIGGLRPARSWELWPRLLPTARLWQLSLGRPLVVAGLAVAPGLWWGRRMGRLRPAEALLLLFVLAYVLLHWLWAVPVWDRYLLPLLPLVAVLVGRSFSCLMSMIARRPALRHAPAVLLLALLVAHAPTAIAARHGRFPIGGNPGADGGAAAVARLLEDAPYGTVLYDHWYSWHWRYQLFAGRVYVSWFPDADALLADLAAFGVSGPPRYIALPNGAAGRPVARRLLAEGYELEAMRQNEAASMTLYRIGVTRRDDG